MGKPSLTKFPAPTKKLLAMRLLSSLLIGAAAFVAETVSVAAEARCFPEGFLFGTATASYQVEGAWNEGGRTPSIWDDFCREKPNVECANVADDFFHRYKDDIQLMLTTGLETFRFSISWSRAMNWDPESKKMKPNQPGIDFYHDLIDELNNNNITPIMTLYHWDLPSELHTELSPPGWLNSEIVDHFMDFAELMYQEYGNKVNYWTTFNEPLSFIQQGYGTGLHAPGFTGSDTQAYIVTHNVLLSHGRAVQRFRELKADSNKIHDAARIGIVLICQNFYPLDPSNPRDVAATERAMQFAIGWFLNPLVAGDYPAVMRERVGDRLPQFTEEEAALVKGSYDLFMVNHYSSNLVTDCDSETSSIDCSVNTAGYERDVGLDATRIPEGARRASKDKNGNYNCVWFNGYAPGYLNMLKWVHKFDPKAEILLTENGWCGNDTIDNQDQLWYYQTYLEQVYKAIEEEKIPIIGYTAWSFVDNYEWGSFSPRFGLYYVNFTSQTGSKEGYIPKATDLARIPRPAATWYSQVVKTGCLGASSSNSGITAATAASSISTSVWSSYWTIGAVVVVVVGTIAVAARRYVTKRGTAAEKAPLL